ncbi:tetratricopeptide repeat protein [candidate division KSB1 bacterium]
MKRFLKIIKWVIPVVILLFIGSIFALRHFRPLEKDETLFEIHPDQEAEIQTLGIEPLDYVLYVLKDRRIDAEYIEDLTRTLQICYDKNLPEYKEQLFDIGRNISISEYRNDYYEINAFLDFMFTAGINGDTDYYYEIISRQFSNDDKNLRIRLANNHLPKIITHQDTETAKELFALLCKDNWYFFVKPYNIMFQYNDRSEDVLTYLENLNDPKASFILYNSLASHYFENGNNNEAVRMLNLAHINKQRIKNPTGWSRYVNVPEKFFEYGDFERAEEVSAELSGAEFDRVSYRLTKAVQIVETYCRQGEFDKAFEFVRETESAIFENDSLRILYYGDLPPIFSPNGDITVKDNPRLRKLNYVIALIYAYNNKPDKAVEILKEIYPNFSNLNETKTEFIKIFAATGEYDHVRSLITKENKDDITFGLFWDMNFYGTSDEVARQLEGYDEILRIYGAVAQDYCGAYIYWLDYAGMEHNKPLYSGSPQYDLDAKRVIADHAYKYYHKFSNPGFREDLYNTYIMLKAILSLEITRTIKTFERIVYPNLLNLSREGFADLLLEINDPARAYDVAKHIADYEKRKRIFRRVAIILAEKNTLLDEASKKLMQSVLTEYASFPVPRSPEKRN